jgi:hypothetical protein
MCAGIQARSVQTYMEAAKLSVHDLGWCRITAQSYGQWSNWRAPAGFRRVRIDVTSDTRTIEDEDCGIFFDAAHMCLLRSIAADGGVAWRGSLGKQRMVQLYLNTAAWTRWVQQAHHNSLKWADDVGRDAQGVLDLWCVCGVCDVWS